MEMLKFHRTNTNTCAILFEWGLNVLLKNSDSCHPRHSAPKIFVAFKYSVFQTIILHSLFCWLLKK